MNALAKKIVLDTIRDTLEQNSQHAMAQAFSTRATGSQMHIEGDFGNGSQFKGTDLDDTVTITGNLVGNAKPWPSEPTLIELLNGNDTVTVEGKIMASENGFLSITNSGYEATGDKTINANSGIENSGGNIDITLNGAGNHSVNVTGDVVTIDEGSTFINLNGSYSTDGNNKILIDGNLIAQNSGTNYLMDTGGYKSDFHILGDVISNGKQLKIISLFIAKLPMSLLMEIY